MTKPPNDDETSWVLSYKGFGPNFRLSRGTGQRVLSRERMIEAPFHDAISHLVANMGTLEKAYLCTSRQWHGRRAIRNLYETLRSERTVKEIHDA